MVLSGKQKAAMLLMGLDALTAAELLKGVPPEAVQELAVELAYLDASGLCNPQQSTEVAVQFCTLLGKQRRFHCQSFLDTMLKSTLGKEKADQIQTQIHTLLRKRDPFISIRSADIGTLASVLEKEHPQATAVVLSELTPKKSSEILGRFNEGVQLSTVSRMAEAASAEVCPMESLCLNCAPIPGPDTRIKDFMNLRDLRRNHQEFSAGIRIVDIDKFRMVFPEKRKVVE